MATQEGMVQKEEIYEGSFIFTAGIAVKRSIVTIIKNIAFEKNIKVKMEESKGFPKSTFRVKLIGARKDVLEIFVLLKKFVDTLK